MRIMCFLVVSYYAMRLEENGRAHDSAGENTISTAANLAGQSSPAAAMNRDGPEASGMGASPPETFSYQQANGGCYNRLDKGEAVCNAYRAVSTPEFEAN
jgi:hypothetical protein